MITQTNEIVTNGCTQPRSVKTTLGDVWFRLTGIEAPDVTHPRYAFEPAMLLRDAEKAVRREAELAWRNGVIRALLDEVEVRMAGRLEIQVKDLLSISFFFDNGGRVEILRVGREDFRKAMNRERVELPPLTIPEKTLTLAVTVGYPEGYENPEQEAIKRLRACVEVGSEDENLLGYPDTPDDGLMRVKSIQAGVPAQTGQQAPAIPAATLSQLKLWKEEGIRPSPFLYDILRGDVFAATVNMDSANCAAMGAILRWIWSDLTSQMYGSTDNVVAWEKDMREKLERKRALEER